MPGAIVDWEQWCYLNDIRHASNTHLIVPFRWGPLCGGRKGAGDVLPDDDVVAFTCPVCRGLYEQMGEVGQQGLRTAFRQIRDAW